MAAAERGYQSGIEVITCTIANGASLSDVADLKGKTLVGIRIPAAWTAAALAFEINEDAGATTYPLFDSAGIEVSIPSANVAASRFYGLDFGRFLVARGVAVRSGTSGATVNQGAQRILTLYLRSV